MQGESESSASHPQLAPDQFLSPLSLVSLENWEERKKEPLVGYRDNYFLSENFIDV